MSSENPGGTTAVRRPGFGAFAQATGIWYSEMSQREDEKKLGYQVGDTVDGHTRPPMWMENKNVTIGGNPVDIEQRRNDDTYWETKYARELMIGELRYKQRMEDFTMEVHDIIGTGRSILRFFGLWAPPKTRKQLEADAMKKFEDRQVVATEEQKKKDMDWNAFVSALESDKPLISVAKDYRNVYDCYGIDECLDSSPAILWIALKAGGCIGICQGGFRAIKTLHVDATFLKASGVGVMTFANVSILAGFAKWAGNLTAAALMFLLGDRMVREVKRYTMPEGAIPIRTPVNYSVGMGMAFGAVGILPWWMLNDAAMGIRLAASSSLVGGAFGYMIGMGMQKLIALNLNRLDYTPAQFRAYQALMKREKAHVESETLRLKKAARDRVAAGLTA